MHRWTPVLITLLFAGTAALAAEPRSNLTRDAAERIARDPVLLADFVRRLPKVELHRHLEGAIRAPTFIALAKRHAIELPATTVEGLKPLVAMTPEDHTLADFLKKFSVISKVWVSLEVVEEVSRQCVLDAHAENIRAVELRFAPHSIARGKGLDPAQVTEAVIRGVQAGERETGTVVSLTVIIPRYLPPEMGLTIEGLARDFAKKGQAARTAGRGFGQVMGIDLAADEARFPPAPFVPAFQRAEADGLHRTVHAGEAAGPESVRVALEGCHAERIGHGVRAFSDPALVERLVKDGTVVEMCPTSNVQTGAVPSFADYPLKAFLDRGGRATVNTDDPGVCDTDLDRELTLAVTRLGCSPVDLETLIRNAVDGIFLPDDVKSAVRASISSEIAVLNTAFERPAAPPSPGR